MKISIIVLLFTLYACATQTESIQSGEQTRITTDQKSNHSEILKENTRIRLKITFQLLKAVQLDVIS